MQRGYSGGTDGVQEGYRRGTVVIVVVVVVMVECGGGGYSRGGR